MERDSVPYEFKSKELVHWESISTRQFVWGIIFCIICGLLLIFLFIEVFGDFVIPFDAFQKFALCALILCITLTGASGISTVYFSHYVGDNSAKNGFVIILATSIPCAILCIALFAWMVAFSFNAFVLVNIILSIFEAITSFLLSYDVYMANMSKDRFVFYVDKGNRKFFLKWNEGLQCMDFYTQSEVTKRISTKSIIQVRQSVQSREIADSQQKKIIQIKGQMETSEQIEEVDVNEHAGRKNIGGQASGTGQNEEIDINEHAGRTKIEIEGQGSPSGQFEENVRVSRSKIGVEVQGSPSGQYEESDINDHSGKKMGRNSAEAKEQKRLSSKREAMIKKGKEEKKIRGKEADIKGQESPSDQQVEEEITEHAGKHLGKEEENEQMQTSEAQESIQEKEKASKNPAARATAAKPQKFKQVEDVKEKISRELDKEMEAKMNINKERSTKELEAKRMVSKELEKLENLSKKSEDKGQSPKGYGGVDQAPERESAGQSSKIKPMQKGAKERGTVGDPIIKPKERGLKPALPSKMADQSASGQIDLEKTHISKQLDSITENRVISVSGRAEWNHTHFIFAFDCSGIF